MNWLKLLQVREQLCSFSDVPMSLEVWIHLKKNTFVYFKFFFCTIGSYFDYRLKKNNIKCSVCKTLRHLNSNCYNNKIPVQIECH